jgi:hypothetical protein
VRFVVAKAEVATIRAVYERGELWAVIELRRRFPALTAAEPWKKALPQPLQRAILKASEFTGIGSYQLSNPMAAFDPSLS